MNLLVSCGERVSDSVTSIKFFELISDWELTEDDYVSIELFLDNQVNCVNTIIDNIGIDLNEITLKLELLREGCGLNAGCLRRPNLNEFIIVVDRYPTAPHFDCILWHELNHIFYLFYGYGLSPKHDISDFDECCPDYCTDERGMNWCKVAFRFDGSVAN